MTPQKHSAQQIIETLLLFVAVILVLLVFFGPTGPFRSSVGRVVNIVIDQLNRP